MKVLLIDTDSQGSIGTILGLKPPFTLHDFLIKQMALSECVTPAHERIDVLCSDRKTMTAEDVINGQRLRETYFEQVFAETGADSIYDSVIVDVAPSLSLFQTCAMLYTRNVVIPAAMETLSVQGAGASIASGVELNRLFKKEKLINMIGILPVMINARLQLTQTILTALTAMAQGLEVPLLPSIRTDAEVAKAARAKQFLADYEPKSKALEDYEKAAEKILKILRSEPMNEVTSQVTTA